MAMIRKLFGHGITDGQAAWAQWKTVLVYESRPEVAFLIAFRRLAKNDFTF